LLGLKGLSFFYAFIFMLFLLWLYHYFYDDRTDKDFGKKNRQNLRSSSARIMTPIAHLLYFGKYILLVGYKWNYN